MQLLLHKSACWLFAAKEVNADEKGPAKKQNKLRENVNLQD